MLPCCACAIAAVVASTPRGSAHHARSRFATVRGRPMTRTCVWVGGARDRTTVTRHTSSRMLGTRPRTQPEVSGVTEVASIYCKEQQCETVNFVCLAPPPRGQHGQR